MTKKNAYIVVCYMRIDPEDPTEGLTIAEAIKEYDQLRLMQPENIYKIELKEE